MNQLSLLKNHLQSEIKKGKFIHKVFLNLLYKLILKIFKKKHVPDVINGLALYDRPLLISYSRSGINWLRYFIEVTTRQPTPGEKRIVGGENYYIDRAHAGFRVLSHYNKVILLIRNYRECLIRHYGLDFIRKYSSVKSFLEDTSIEQPAHWYLKNIISYDQYPKEKMLIYYEDLISQPQTELNKLSKFLHLPETEVSKFMDEIEKHKTNSIKAYTSMSQESQTNGQVDKLNYHSENLSKDEIIEFDLFFKEKLGSLYFDYLKRYKFSSASPNL